jgi:DNA gyrase/topoisomerase IV subunit A
VVITEIPYQVVKSRLVERIADLLLSKKLPLLAMCAMNPLKICAWFWNQKTATSIRN